jgi:hypothetical protein
MSKKSINEKLKESVQKSLDSAKEAKVTKKKEPRTEEKYRRTKESYEGAMDSLGIPKYTHRRQRVTVYRFWRHLKRTIDHVRFPSARMEPVEDSPMFVTWAESEATRVTLEAANPDYYYYARPGSVNADELDSKFLAACKKRGWGFHE